MAGGRVGKKMENGVDLNAVIKEKRLDKVRQPII